MASTKKQKSREAMAELADNMTEKGNRYSRWLRNKNREIEKRKRKQFNQDSEWR